jgi:hypothetical protein
MSEVSKSFDKTMLRNEQRMMLVHIQNYELIKSNKHPHFKNVKEFLLTIGMCRQNFLKFYNRYKQSNDVSMLLPQKRGPRYRTRRPSIAIEMSVKKERNNGANRYEIFEILKNIYHESTPSPSGIYNILKRLGMNKLKTKEIEMKRKIIKERLGELGHTDCHDLPKGLATEYPKKLYLVGLLDSCSRIAWCEIILNKKSLTVMFGLMRCFSAIKKRYGIEFEEIINDNGPEFGGNKTKSGEIVNPVQLLFLEIGVKQRFTRPYRPQTNGKMERFWRTINEDFIEGTTFATLEELKKELIQYMIYYNEYRPHQGIGGKKPIDICKEKLEKK